MMFTSKYNGLRVVLIPARNIYDQFGQRTYVAGVSAQFVNGVCEITDETHIKMLMKHPGYGIDFMAHTPEGTDSHVNPEGEERLKEEEAGLQLTMHSCPKCSFKAKNAFGLQSHIRARHAEEE